MEVEELEIIIVCHCLHIPDSFLENGKGVLIWSLDARYYIQTIPPFPLPADTTRVNHIYNNY